MLIITWKRFNIFQNIEKIPQVSSTICIQMCFCLLPLGSAVNENGDSTTEGVLCSAIREFRIGHCDFFLWGYVKDTAYVPPLPRNLHELWLLWGEQQRICCSESGKKLTIGRMCAVWHEVYILRVCNEQVWNLGSFSIFWNILNLFQVIINIITVI
jgi:hypothetical protein